MAIGENRSVIGAALAPFRERNFRLLWFGQAVSAVGDALVPVALAFATLAVAHSASALGLVLAVSTVGSLIALPAGGVWSDRLPRQLVMLTSDGVRAAAHGVMAVLLISGHAQLWQLVVQALVYSFAGGFFLPASSALVPQTVSAPRLQQANALMGLSRSMTQVVAPAVAGVLVAAFGPGWVFGIDAVTFVVSAVSLAMLDVAPVPGAHQSKFWTELAAGLQAVTSRRWYLLNLGAHALWNFAFAAFLVLGPIVAKEKLGGASAWGLISASLGAGAVLGGLIALRVTPRRPLVVANLALVPAAFQLLALAVPLPTAGIMAFCVVGWIGLTFLNEVWFATVPQLIPADVLARATSFDWLLSIVAMPIGFAISGPLADHIGVQATLIGAAAIMGAPCVLIVLVPGVRRVKRTPAGTIVME
jgi:MFS family permease